MKMVFLDSIRKTERGIIVQKRRKKNKSVEFFLKPLAGFVYAGPKTVLNMFRKRRYTLVAANPAGRTQILRALTTDSQGNPAYMLDHISASINQDDLSFSQGFVYKWAEFEYEWFPLPVKYWRNHPDAWPLESLVLGNQVYAKNELLNILEASPRRDASLDLARQLITSLLNIANGSDMTAVCSVIAEAHDSLSRPFSRLPYGIQPHTAMGRVMVSDAMSLAEYNNDH